MIRALAEGEAGERAALLAGTHGVRVTARGEGGSCPECGAAMVVRKSLVRQVRTLAHGTFRLHETERVCRAGCREGSGERVRSRSGGLGEVLLPRSSVGYDVMVHVGLARYLRYRQRAEIREALGRDHGVVLSTGEISRLARLFLTYLERLHVRRGPELRAALEGDGGWPLHIDATGENGRGTLLVLYAGWRGWVMGAFKIPTENAEAIGPCLHQVASWAGHPVAIVRDLGRAMIPACEAFRSEVGGAFRILSCHYHLLADVGRDLLKAGHGELRELVRRFRVRSGLRAFVRELGRTLGEEIEAARLDVLAWQEQGGGAPPIPQGRAGLAVVRAVAQWPLDSPIESTGKDFPFVLPHLDFYDRSTKTLGLLHPWLRTRKADPEVLAAVRRLARILEPIRSQVPFRTVTERLRERARLFDQLRDALRLVPKDPDGSRPPASESSPEEFADVASDLEDLRSTLAKRRATDDLPADTREGIDIICDHLDRHGDTLFGHLIELPEERGGGVRLVERTNDILENFFRTLKHGERRRSGRKILTQDFEALPPAAALARNLRCLDYVQLLSGSLDALSTAFATLDREDRQRRRAGLLLLDHAPAAHPVPETARASLPLEDRRILRTKSMNELMQRAATA